VHVRDHGESGEITAPPWFC